MTETNMYFRPTIVIFMDDVGERIYHQLSSARFLESVAESLRPCIGLIQVSPDMESARSWFVSDIFSATPKIREDILDYIIETMLRSVQLDSNIQKAISAGYNISHLGTQIYLVGHARSKSAGTILYKVYEQLYNLYGNDPKTEVYYVLNYYGVKRNNPVNIETEAVSQKNASQISIEISEKPHGATVHFCYLYGDMRYPSNAFVTETESLYATAEALFALIATGITSHAIFRQEMQTKPNLNYFGTLSTCLIFFPRTAVRSYCVAELCRKLMDQWLSDVNESIISPNDHEVQHNLARVAVEDIEHWIEDSEPRPAANLTSKGWWKRLTVALQENKPRANAKEHTWPSLNILRKGGSTQLYDEYEKKRKQLQSQTVELFELLAFERVNKQYKKQKSIPRTWIEVVDEHLDTAENVYKEWDDAATAAWGLARAIACAEFKYSIDQVWRSTDSDTGFKLADIYIEEFKASLADLTLNAWQASHDNDYNNTLDETEQTVKHLMFKKPKIRKIKSEEKSMHDMVNPGTESKFVIQDADKRLPLDQPKKKPYLPERERNIAQSLEQRITKQQSYVPSGLTLSAGGFLTIFMLVLIIFTLFPMLAEKPLMPMIVAGVVVGSLVLCGSIWQWYLKRKLVKVQKELLRLYRSYYAHLCELREDVQRSVLIKTLLTMTQQVDIKGLLTEVLKGFQDTALSVHDDLFNSPAASHDLLVVNGSRLQKSDPGATNTLQRFAEELLHQSHPNARKLLPQFSELKSYLLKEMENHSTSILEMTGQLQKYIHECVSDVVDERFEGSSFGIQTALDSQEIWHYAFERVRNPFCRLLGDAQSPQMLFICGHSQELGQQTRSHIEALYKEAVVMDIYNAERLLVAAFFRSALTEVPSFNFSYPNTPFAGT